MSDIRVKQELVGTSPIPATYPGATGLISHVQNCELGSSTVEAVLVEYEVAGGLACVKTHVPLEDVKVLCIVNDEGDVENVIGTPNIRNRLQGEGKTGFICCVNSGMCDNEIRWPTTAEDLEKIDFDLIRSLLEGPLFQTLGCRCPSGPC